MNVFDIIGPIMIGPSSSHTAGAVRIGLMSRLLLGSPAVKAYIRLHGSFAQTYKGHGTDRALAAGIMGMNTDDERIRKSLEIAKKLNQFPECPLMNDDGRVTAIERSDFVLFNIYFPNGGERADGTEMLSYKLKFYQEYQQEVQRLIQAGKKVITTGDFNICHRPIDIARPKENENSI